MGYRQGGSGAGGRRAGRGAGGLRWLAVWVLFQLGWWSTATTLAAAPIFEVTAPSALLVDADTGQVLFSKNPDIQLPPASIAKIMTLLLALEAVDAGKAQLTDKVTTSAHASRMGGSEVYLREGEVHSLEEMLEAIAIHSANDASVAVAEHLAGTEQGFVELMNRRAKELGMTRTLFSNPTGLPPDPGEPPTVTTAHDIAIMARELVKHPKIFTWTTIQRKVFREKPLLILENTNKLIGRYPGLDGLKTGHTSEAGFGLVATAKRGDVRLISVVLKTPSEKSREEQTIRLLDFGFNRFKPVVLATAGQSVGQLTFPQGSPYRIDVTVARPLRVLVLPGQEGAARLELRLSRPELPVKAGQVVGQAVAVLDGKPVAMVDAVAARDVHRANVLVRAWRWLISSLGRLWPW